MNRYACTVTFCCAPPCVPQSHEIAVSSYHPREAAIEAFKQVREQSPNAQDQSHHHARITVRNDGQEHTYRIEREYKTTYHAREIEENEATP